MRQWFPKQQKLLRTLVVDIVIYNIRIFHLLKIVINRFLNLFFEPFYYVGMLLAHFRFDLLHWNFFHFDCYYNVCYTNIVTFNSWKNFLIGKFYFHIIHLHRHTQRFYDNVFFLFLLLYFYFQIEFNYQNPV